MHPYASNVVKPTRLGLCGLLCDGDIGVRYIYIYIYIYIQVFNLKVGRILI
jgi:hypothetical protein